VLGPQVAVPVDDPAFTYARHNRLASVRKEAALNTIDPSDQTRRDIEARVEQHLAIVR